jgi:peptidoglycan/LPS O-acetylase OafA/YrhL
MSEIKKERLVVFDFIRLFAILMVVLSHTLKVGSVPFDIGYLGILGNALFFFISGYLIYLNNSTFKSKKDILKFYKKRLLRIYPLYIMAFLFLLFVSFILGTANTYSPFEIITSILGLQMVFYPKLITSPIILWFIGMILIFYVIYPLVMYFSRQSIIKYFILSCFAIGLLVLVKVFTGFIGGGVFEYYFVFVAGVLAAWVQIFKSKKIHIISILSWIIFAICVFITQVIHPSIGDAEHLSLSLSVIIPVGFVILLRMIYGISAVFVLYSAFNFIKPNKNISSFIVSGAFAAYAVYLFHGPFFSIVNKIITSIGGVVSEFILSPIVYDILLILISIPVIFIIGYFLQKGENICIKKIKMKFSAKH